MIRIEAMRREHWPAVARIYEEGLELGTFEARILDGNDPSVLLHERCGFRHVGLRSASRRSAVSGAASS